MVVELRQAPERAQGFAARLLQLSHELPFDFFGFERLGSPRQWFGESVIESPTAFLVHKLICFATARRAWLTYAPWFMLDLVGGYLADAFHQLREVKGFPEKAAAGKARRPLPMLLRPAAGTEYDPGAAQAPRGSGMGHDFKGI